MDSTVYLPKFGKIWSPEVNHDENKVPITIHIENAFCFVKKIVCNGNVFIYRTN